MPASLIFHKGNTLALYRMGNNCSRHALCAARFCKRLTQLFHIVAVCNVNYMEIESAELLVDRIRGAYVLDLSIDLQTVVIYNKHEIIQLMEAGKHRSFPNLSFLNLAIAQKRIYAELFVCHFSAQCHADSGRNTLSKGSLWTYLRPESYPDRDVPANKNRDDAVSPDPLPGKKHSMCQGRIQTGCKYVPWKEQNDPGLPSSDLPDQYSSLQNTGR